MGLPGVPVAKQPRAEQRGREAERQRWQFAENIVRDLAEGKIDTSLLIGQARMLTARWAEAIEPAGMPEGTKESKQ